MRTSIQIRVLGEERRIVRGRIVYAAPARLASPAEMEIPRWVVDAAMIIGAAATIVLAIATLILALATRHLVRSATDESQHVADQARATTALASTSAQQLDELKKQNTNRPLLIWAQRADEMGRGVEVKWSPDADGVSDRTGKSVEFSLMLRAENLGGSASMGDARIRWGDGRITYEMPRRLVPQTRDYLVRITFDAVGGKSFRYAGVIDVPFSSWNTGEGFAAHVLVALASDWFDTNDPYPMVVQLDREASVDEDAKHWIARHFDGYDKYIAANRHP